MARARYHYMVDFFWPDATQVDGFRRESGSIVAYDDSEAIKESERASISAHPDRGPPAKLAYFRVRKVYTKREEVIFDSRKATP
jgi:hypothetical protein